MTNEEKLLLFYDNSLDSAREEARKQTEERKAALEKLFREHKEEKLRQAKIELDSEEQRIRRENNARLAGEQLKIRHQLAEKTHEIKERVFADVEERLNQFKKSPDYSTYLMECIRKAMEEMNVTPSQITFYMDPSDAALAASISERCGVKIELTDEKILGGIQSRLNGKNVLIDDSFSSRLSEIWNTFSVEESL